MFFGNSYFLNDPTDIGNFTSVSSAFSKTSLNIWKFTVHILLKLGLENFKHYFTSMWIEYNCVVVWAFFGIAFLCDWNENWPFPVLWPLLSFLDLLAYWVQHTYGGKQRRPKEHLDDSERGEWKAGVKLNIQKIKIMPSGHITSWQIHGETVEKVADFILGVSKFR